ncbi:acyltransferase family protein [Demequina lignilytica]|uniref:Acyltransferase n=1 Tax=Demequina lignilytica TaxID=3051663 RepID=A0AB35MKN5_9MICO|nr:acyltransferase [Demequina sp. SYSU T0a273]MDN4484180.1 acyltransferase [Demequina sp. SYSU T0a273]
MAARCERGLFLRNSRLEALRVAAMFAIVAHHSVFYGMRGAQGAEMALSPLLVAWSSLGKWGVDVFVLVGAYFMADTGARWRHARATWIQTWTTSVVLLAVVLLVPHADAVPPAAIVEAVLPVFTGEYWFITNYLVLMALSPLLVLAIKNMDKRGHLIALALPVVMWSLGSLVPLPGDLPAFSNLAWFVVLFLVGAFLRRYGIPFRAAVSRNIALASTASVAAGAAILAEVVPRVFPGQDGTATISAQTSPIVLLGAASAVAWAVTGPSSSWPFVDRLAATMLGVYLVHENPLVRSALWSATRGFAVRLTGVDDEALVVVLSSLAVFVIAIGLELLRRFALQRPADAAARRIEIVTRRVAQKCAHLVYRWRVRSARD